MKIFDKQMINSLGLFLNYHFCPKIYPYGTLPQKDTLRVHFQDLKKPNLKRAAHAVGRSIPYDMSAPPHGTIINGNLRTWKSLNITKQGSRNQKNS